MGGHYLMALSLASPNVMGGVNEPFLVFQKKMNRSHVQIGLNRLFVYFFFKRS